MRRNPTGTLRTGRRPAAGPTLASEPVGELDQAQARKATAKLLAVGAASEGLDLDAEGDRAAVYALASELAGVLGARPKPPAQEG